VPRSPPLKHTTGHSLSDYLTKGTTNACRSIVAVWWHNTWQSPLACCEEHTEVHLAKSLVSTKGLEASFQMTIAPAPGLNFELRSGSFWFFIWAPAPGKLSSSGATAPKPCIIYTRILNVILASYYNSFVQLFNGLVQQFNTFFKLNSLNLLPCVCFIRLRGLKRRVQSEKGGWIKKVWETLV